MDTPDADCELLCYVGRKKKRQRLAATTRNAFFDVAWRRRVRYAITAFVVAGTSTTVCILQPVITWNMVSVGITARLSRRLIKRTSPRLATTRKRV